MPNLFPGARFLTIIALAGKAIDRKEADRIAQATAGSAPLLTQVSDSFFVDVLPPLMTKG